MEKTYNIQDFLSYANIDGYKNNHIHLTQYEEQPNIRKQSASIQIDFYLLAIKLNYDKEQNYGQTKLDQSDSFVYLDQPGNHLEWSLSETLSGYHILIDAVVFKKLAREYSFVHYKNHEGLFITKEEENIIIDLFQKAYAEFKKDNFSKDIVLSYASLILSYIQSFYNRQFDTRSKLYNETVANFYKNLEDYYKNDKPANHSPTVSYFAEKANLSSNYFGDMIKHYTGNSPQEHIQQLIVQTAKNKLRNSQLSISEIAYNLGFEYPTYFTRFFKKATGITPNVFRNQ
nr:helix-turn-helix domain-containing protein [uncultured Flavobacterium sp.]